LSKTDLLLRFSYACSMAENKKPQPKKRSLPHTRAVQRDRSKRANGIPPDEVLIEQMEAVIHPAVYAQMDIYYAMGLRVRILTLPVMVAFVLGLIWRQLGSVREAVRVLHEEGMLWLEPLEGVSPQAVLERMTSLPAVLFYRVLLECVPQMQARAEARQRPLPPAVAWARQHFQAIWALDGSTLDGLLRKCGLLQEKEGPVLGGKIGTLFDVATHMPAHIWYEEDSQAHDAGFWPQVLTVLTRGCLLLLDKGLIDFAIFDELSERQVGFITRPKSNTQMQVRQVLSKTATVHDALIRLGSGPKQCAHPMRLVKVLFRGKWYAYLTNVLDPVVLPAECVVALYDQRWRIEDAFNVVKRLLGLAYFHTGSLNGLQVQLWATWLLYTLLVDLTDAVAEALHRPFKEVSLEMVFRGLYHFAHAHHKGRADDPIEYFARKAKDLALIKYKRPKKRLSLIEQMELTIPSIP
jgi:hypothetical protein